MNFPIFGILPFEPETLESQSKA